MVQIHPELPLQLLIGISVAMWGTTELCFSLLYQRTLSQSPFTLPGPTSHHHTDQLLCASAKIPAILTQWKPAQTRLGATQEGWASHQAGRAQNLPDFSVWAEKEESGPSRPFLTDFNVCSLWCRFVTAKHTSQFQLFEVLVEEGV